MYVAALARVYGVHGTRRGDGQPRAQRERASESESESEGAKSSQYINCYMFVVACGSAHLGKINLPDCLGQNDGQYAISILPGSDARLL